MDPLIRAEVVIGENSRRLLIEKNITLTVPALNVRNVDPKVINITTDVISDRLIIQGVVNDQIFFVGEDNIVHHQAGDVPFSVFLDLPGAEPGMNVQIDPVVDTVIFDLVTPTVLQLRLVLELQAKVAQTKQLNVVAGDGPLVRVDQVVGESAREELFENTLTLTAAATRIDDLNVTVKDLTTHIVSDKVIIEGTLQKQIFFVGPNNIELHQADNAKFTTFVDVPGITPGMNVEIIPNVEFVNYALVNPTGLLQQVVVNFFARVTDSVQMHVRLGQGATLRLETVIGENTNQILMENTHVLPMSTVRIREIIASVRNLTSEAIDNRVVIQGTLHKQIFFIGSDNLEHHQIEEIPLSTFVDVPGVTPGMNVRVNPKVETILFELADQKTLNKRVVAEFAVAVTEMQQLQVQVASAS